MQKEKELNYKKLGLRCGIELHNQLDTKCKLFCSCSTAMQEKEPVKIIMRKMHPVASELGEIDVAAQFEYLRNRTFYYQVFKNESCLVELDEEPPHDLNKEALHIALQIALLLNCEIPNEIHIMRKTLIDGSAISGFQRTAVIGLNGYLRYKGKKIEIKHVSLEEDAAAIVSEEEGKVTYRLNRLGVPLVEIGTGILAGYTPQEIQEIAYLIGIICRSTGRVKHGIGSTRQDVNVSIKKGARVEIKGIQELGMIAKVVELEVKRQASLPKVKEETRSALPNGTTRFTRPLPGAGRLYPESDLLPIPLSKEFIAQIKKNLPERWDKKLQKFKSKLKLSDLLAKEILRSGYLNLFEDIVSKIKITPSVVANTFVNILTDLRRRNIPIENLKDDFFVELFKLIGKNKLAKESIPVILEELSQNPDKPMSEIIKDKNLLPITEAKLIKLVRNKMQENISLLKDKRTAFNALIGIVMKEVRGRIDGEIVNKVIKKEIKRYFH